MTHTSYAWSQIDSLLELVDHSSRIAVAYIATDITATATHQALVDVNTL
jgi:hypothetical protein